jgi:hypothetical protein
VAEATEEVVEKPEAPPPEPAEETPAPSQDEPETPTDGDDDGEPNGSDGKAVYQRKMHRRAVQAERDAADLRERLARLEGELTVRREKPEPEKPKEPTIAEVVKAMEEGTVSAAQGAAYIAKKTAQEERARERQEEAAQKPILTAQQTIDEYKQLVPGLSTKSHAKWSEVQSEYNRLTATLGLPHSLSTEVLAVEHIFGKVEAIKAKRNMDRTDREGARFHSERGGGAAASEQKPDHNKASRDQVALWEKLGVSAEDRAKEWEYIRARQAKRGTP